LPTIFGGKKDMEIFTFVNGKGEKKLLIGVCNDVSEPA
jgi:hypothetical protein